MSFFVYNISYDCGFNQTIADAPSPSATGFSVVLGGMKMGLVKCPRCELNYMNDTDTMCSVCRREVRGESEQFEMIELCSECGENPVVPGQELCAYCLKEQARRNEIDNDEEIQHEPANIDIDSVSTMDEIELDIGGDLNDAEFADDADFDDEDEEDDEDDEDADIDGDDEDGEE